MTCLCYNLLFTPTHKFTEVKLDSKTKNINKRVAQAALCIQRGAVMHRVARRDGDILRILNHVVDLRATGAL